MLSKQFFQVEYSIIDQILDNIKVEIEWKLKCHSFYWHSINGYEINIFCQAPRCTSQFENHPCTCMICIQFEYDLCVWRGVNIFCQAPRCTSQFENHPCTCMICISIWIWLVCLTWSHDLVPGIRIIRSAGIQPVLIKIYSRVFLEEIILASMSELF